MPAKTWNQARLDDQGPCEGCGRGGRELFHHDDFGGALCDECHSDFDESLEEHAAYRADAKAREAASA